MALQLDPGNLLARRELDWFDSLSASISSIAFEPGKCMQLLREEGMGFRWEWSVTSIEPQTSNNKGVHEFVLRGANSVCERIIGKREKFAAYHEELEAVKEFIGIPCAIKLP